MTSPPPPDAAEGSDPLGAVLLEAGWLRPAGGRPRALQVRRGMAVHSADGRLLGHVAAVLAPRGNGAPPGLAAPPARAITYLVLARWGEHLEYRLVPVAVVAEAGPGTVRLSIAAEAVDSFVRHTPPELT